MLTASATFLKCAEGERDSLLVELQTRGCRSASYFPSLYYFLLVLLHSLPLCLSVNLQLNCTSFVLTQQYPRPLWKMEELLKYGISGNLSRNELTLALSNLPVTSLKSLGGALFNSVHSCQTYLNKALR